MKILSIETSCDETAVAILDCEGGLLSPSFKILGNSLFSQVDLHKEYGGVYPNLARREHAKNLIPLLIKSLKEADLYKEKTRYSLSPEAEEKIEKILSREPQLLKEFKETLGGIEKPEVDFIAVTEGPGLAPALWVGVSFSEALRALWGISVIPINHMEGHIWSVLTEKRKVEFPAIALLVSGGHTELIYIKNFKDFEVLGRTRDDAVGEAYDKVARLLGLPYPGGPEISRLAESHRSQNKALNIKFPEPMVKSSNFDFSFSGLKTAVLYKLKELPFITEEIKEEVARAFEEAAINVLISKTQKALEAFEAKTLIVGGGVIANTYLRKRLIDLSQLYSGLHLYLPEKNLATDNAIMIGMSAYLEIIYTSNTTENLSNLSLRANGNLKL